MDFYEVLGIKPGSTREEIQTAYRELARKWHPDVCTEPGSASRFREIRQAYEVLTERESRALYDREIEADVPVRVVSRRSASIVREVSPKSHFGGGVREIGLPRHVAERDFKQALRRFVFGFPL